jgi:pyridoxine 5-phosphate synthase
MQATSSILLGVNIDHIATVRQARGTRFPEVIQAALIAEQAGADGITAHLREDRRHIQDRDIALLSSLLQTRLNLEMAVTDEMVEIAVKVRPGACCLVPEKRAELTTEGGLNVVGNFDQIKAACEALGGVGIEVSLFIDADSPQIEAAVRAGAPVVELHTGHYADAATPGKRLQELQRLRIAAQRAAGLGLVVNAGHGLHYHNVDDVCRIPEFRELNIGHSIIARALFSGLEQAVRDMKSIMQMARVAASIDPA